MSGLNVADDLGGLNAIAAAIVSHAVEQGGQLVGASLPDSIRIALDDALRSIDAGDRRGWAELNAISLSVLLHLYTRTTN